MKSTLHTDERVCWLYLFTARLSTLLGGSNINY